jgi:hypothetical protein
MLRIQLNQPKPTFEQRLAQEAHRIKELAKTLPHGKERELLSSRPGNSRPLRTSASGYRLPDSSDRGRGASCPRQF